MKSIWHILIAVLLGLLLAGATWQDVHAPQHVDIAPNEEQGATIVARDTPRPSGGGQLANSMTAVPGKRIHYLESVSKRLHLLPK